MATIDYLGMLEAGMASHEARIGGQHDENEKKAAEAIAKIVDTAETNKRRIEAGFGVSPLPAADADDKQNPVAVAPPVIDPFPAPTTPTPIVVAPVAPKPPAPAKVTTTRKSRWNVKNWTGWQRLVALAGLFVGFTVGMATYEAANANLMGWWAVAFNVTWVILVTLFCFFLFGLLFGLGVNFLAPKPEVVKETTTTTTAPAPASAS